MSGLCSHGHLLCVHERCASLCADCLLDMWAWGELDDALGRWTDDGGPA